MEISLNEMDQQLDNFYNKKFYFSYSSFNKLLWDPYSFFQMYVLGIREERLEKHLIEGQVIHALMLSVEQFNELFIISPANLPTGNTKQLVDQVFFYHTQMGGTTQSLIHYRSKILDVMKSIGYYQSLKDDKATKLNPDIKTGDDKRIEKILTDETTSYWEFLKSKGKKTLIDQQTYDYCIEAASRIKGNQRAMELLGAGYDDFASVEIINEVVYQADLEGYEFGIKGIIDNLVIDHDKKMIYINDLKTSSKDLKDFKDSVEYWQYWLQAAIYVQLIQITYRHLIEKGYQIVFHFIVIDQRFHVYPFPVSKQTMERWLEQSVAVFNKANYHYKNRRYSLPYEFDTGLISL